MLIMPTISVIVPIYNVEKYLEKCIVSILDQTFRDFELLLIDDGSPDDSIQICEKYRLVDSRIKIIRKKNGGLSSARNCGIDNAEGMFYTFIDSDDWVGVDFLEKLLNAIQFTNAQIAVCGYDWDYDDNNYVQRIVSNKNEVYRLDKAKYIEKALLGEGFSVSAWGKLYKKELFDVIRFPEGRLFEDLAIFPEIVKQVEHAVYIPFLGYHYRVRKDSILHSVFSDKKLDYVEMALKCKDKLTGECDTAVLDLKVLMACVDTLMDMERPSTIKQKEMQYECLDRVKEFGIWAIRDKRLNKKYKAFIICRQIGVYRIFSKLYKNYAAVKRNV